MRRNKLSVKDMSLALSGHVEMNKKHYRRLSKKIVTDVFFIPRLSLPHRKD